MLLIKSVPRNKKARTLSRGQRAKLEVAVGMCRGADFILMDEPFLGKDPFTRRDFLKLMISLLTPEEAVVIATHDVAEIENYITRAVILDQGRLAADADMELLRESGAGLLAYIRQVCRYDEDRVEKALEPV